MNLYVDDTAFYFSSKTLKKYIQENLEAEYWPFESFEPNIFFVDHTKLGMPDVQIKY